MFYTHPPMKMEKTECSETSAYKNSDARELPRFENVGVFIREKFWLENSLSQ